MKTTIVTVLLLLSTTISGLRAQTVEENLKASYDKFTAANTEQELIAASSRFDMAAAKWAGTWQTYLYAAYAKISVSLKLSDKTKRDQYLDAADAYLGKAEKLSPDNQEVLIMQAWSAKARIAVDAKDRWKKFGEVYDDRIAKAKKTTAENPRIYFLEGHGPFYKPKVWGGGKDKAKPYFEKAKELLAKESKTDIMHPYWGSKEVEEFLAQCNE